MNDSFLRTLFLSCLVSRRRETVPAGRTGLPELEPHLLSVPAPACRRLLLLAFAAVALAGFVQCLGQFLTVRRCGKGTEMCSRRCEHQHDGRRQVSIDIHAAKEFGL